MTPSSNLRPPGRESTALGRRIGVVLWCSFLAASLATMLAFAFIDPLSLGDDDLPHWRTARLTVYAIGFFFFWLICVLASALTLFMATTERAE